MLYVIVLLGPMGTLAPADPRYVDCPSFLVDCDVDAFDGLGSITGTASAQHARTFSSKEEAFHYWKRESIVAPLRIDGLPNRPLTLYTVEIAEAPR